MKIKIRWIDGFCRELECSDYQMGKDNYWFKLVDGRQKWIPRENIRSITILPSDDNRVGISAYSRPFTDNEDNKTITVSIPYPANISQHTLNTLAKPKP